MKREDDIIKVWGGVKEFHEELKKFMEQHKNADGFIHDEQRCLVGASYQFKPYKAWADMMKNLRVER